MLRRMHLTGRCDCDASRRCWRRRAAAAATTRWRREGRRELTVYSGREEEIVEPLFEHFEQETGIKVKVRYGDSAELAATIAEEGDNSPADRLLRAGPGLGRLGGGGRPLAELPDGVLERVPERFRDPDEHWVGTSGRVRVVAYNTDDLEEGELPDSIFGFTDERWKGKIGVPADQRLVPGIRHRDAPHRRRGPDADVARGDQGQRSQALREELSGGRCGRPRRDRRRLRQPLLPVLRRRKTRKLPVANDYIGRAIQARSSAPRLGILEASDDEDDAERFVEFLLSDQGQRFYSEGAEEAEYPLVEGIEPRKGLPPLGELQGPDVELGGLGPELEKTLELLNEVGFTT